MLLAPLPRASPTRRTTTRARRGAPCQRAEDHASLDRPDPGRASVLSPERSQGVYFFEAATIRSISAFMCSASASHSAGRPRCSRPSGRRSRSRTGSRRCSRCGLRVVDAAGDDDPLTDHHPLVVELVQVLEDAFFGTKSSIGGFIVFGCGPLLIRLAMKMRKAPQMQAFPVAGAGFEPATSGL